MWRSRNNEPQMGMGYHAWPEQTMDERYLETIPEVESLYSQYSRRSSVATTTLPELPFRAVPPLNEYEPAQSYDLVTLSDSNPYYQQSTSRIPRPRDNPAEPSNVSPVSTPNSLHPDDSEGSLVSPIDLAFPMPAGQSQAEPGSQSKIPRKLPLAAPKNNEDVPKRWALRKSDGEETRWDEYSGEPSEAGKPPSARPGTTPILEQQYPQLKERTRQILAGLKEREAVKSSGWGKMPPPVEPDPLDHPPQRPAWKGASGRHAIVEPVKNTPAARTRPLMMAARNKQTDEQATSETASTIPSEKTPRSPIDAVSVAASTLPTIRSISSDDSIKPVAPLKGRNTPRVLSPTTAEHTTALDSPFRSPGPAPPMYEPAPSVSPAPSTIQDYGGDSPTLGSNASFTGERSSSEDSLETTVRPKPLQRALDTSSSWNTYTSMVEPHSPFSRAEMTSSPVSMTGPDVPSPIFLRKRVAANNSGHKSYDTHSGISPFSNMVARKSSSSILRKAVGAEQKPLRAVSLMSGLSMTKSLPPTPVELQAANKAASLEARLEDLSRRKRNQHKIISELRDSLKRNAIIYDARKRNEIDKMITNLNLEIQEITNEEHETSLRLHRVVKRRDRDEFYEQPTGLWIKRVTS
ncbi:hypothetical protein LTR99_006723 [Exophiala xenobiotica]|uniref:Uncharacterized protein n=1 Tax=Vermiconidia calcicola TaxID=1690605 RepID=A0AAV9Q0R3_9PEZI|nr:hypothetical protein H2202_001567 [Exophiala xenobiotica]KAK5527804.1 hypothetical protein LTR23_011193 [Chaetothyriales sp. CCFEE 6169]KAK5531720.1 hypothetical protein LTR25_008050 [Vermiconidia calcicola]KAK5193172.1 hypothetical protein LTR92_006541 [Exophiala xenobiotica]KAK5204795.1 hypothetical protein LTR41_009651 [Exophiala xenobiotica]